MSHARLIPSSKQSQNHRPNPGQACSRAKFHLKTVTKLVQFPLLFSSVCVCRLVLLPVWPVDSIAPTFKCRPASTADGQPAELLSAVAGPQLVGQQWPTVAARPQSAAQLGQPELAGPVLVVGFIFRRRPPLGRPDPRPIPAPLVAALFLRLLGRCPLPIPLPGFAPDVPTTARASTKCQEISSFGGWQRPLPLGLLHPSAAVPRAGKLRRRGKAQRTWPPAGQGAAEEAADDDDRQWPSAKIRGRPEQQW
jgi:hypothetical protein